MLMEEQQRADRERGRRFKTSLLLQTIGIKLSRRKKATTEKPAETFQTNDGGF